jgi:hypothetical protein
MLIKKMELKTGYSEFGFVSCGRGKYALLGRRGVETGRMETAEAEKTARVWGSK